MSETTKRPVNPPSQPSAPLWLLLIITIIPPALVYLYVGNFLTSITMQALAVTAAALWLLVVFAATIGTRGGAA